MTQYKTGMDKMVVSRGVACRGEEKIKMIRGKVSGQGQQTQEGPSHVLAAAPLSKSEYISVHIQRDHSFKCFSNHTLLLPTHKGARFKLEATVTSSVVQPVPNQ